MSVKKNRVEVAHRNAAACALFRAMGDEPWHCEACYQRAIKEVAQALAERRVVMLRRTAEGMKFATWS